MEQRQAQRSTNIEDRRGPVPAWFEMWVRAKKNIGLDGQNPITMLTQAMARREAEKKWQMAKRWYQAKMGIEPSDEFLAKLLYRDPTDPQPRRNANANPDDYLQGNMWFTGVDLPQGMFRPEEAAIAASTGPTKRPRRSTPNRKK